MNKKEERDQFWINVGPESGYLGTIAEETARKNDGGISPDGKRLGWKNAADCTAIPNGNTNYNCNAPCDCDTSCDCGTDCDCGDGRGCGCDQDHNCNREGDCDRDKRDIATDYPYGDPCDDALTPVNIPICEQQMPGHCNCNTPERQNTETGE